MQIHELNNFNGTPGSTNYLAIDDGSDTGRISGTDLLAPVNGRVDNLVANIRPTSQETLLLEPNGLGGRTATLGTLASDYDFLEFFFADLNAGEIVQSVKAPVSAGAVEVSIPIGVGAGTNSYYQRMKLTWSGSTLTCSNITRWEWDGNATHAATSASGGGFLCDLVRVDGIKISTEQNAEVVDLRTAHNGTVYNSAREAREADYNAQGILISQNAEDIASESSHLKALKELKTELISGVSWEVGVIDQNTGQALASTTRIRTAGYVNINDAVSLFAGIESGYKYAFLYYGANRSYINWSGWQTTSKLIAPPSGTALVRICLANTSDTTVTTAIATNFTLNEMADAISILKGIHNIDIANYGGIGATWVLGVLNPGTGTFVASSTRIVSSYIHVNKGNIIHLVDTANYEYYMFYFKNNSGSYLSEGSWITTDSVVPYEDCYIRICMRKKTNVAIQTNEIYKISSNLKYYVDINAALDNLVLKESLAESLYDIEMAKEGYQELYIGELINGHLVASGVVNDSYTNYRLSTPEIVAFPGFEGTTHKVKVKLNPGYIVAIRCGANSIDLTSNLYWYSNGDEITIPNGANYYAISVAAADSGNYLTTQISPSEDIGLKLYIKYNHDIKASNDGASCILNSARLFFSSSQRNELQKYPVLSHTSDCHGDYQRVKNFLKFSEGISVDAALITGDICSYKPSQKLDWFHDMVNNANVLPGVCVGNHDVNDNSYTDSDVYDFFYDDIAAKIGNTTGKTWYYTDIASKKLRIISVNLYQYGGSTRWFSHFTDEQLAWLASTLSSTPTGYGIIILSHSPQTSLAGAKDANYPDFYQDVRKYNDTFNYITGGVPLYDIVDAFINRSSISKTYTQDGSPASVSVSADFSSVDSSIEFIAHLTGHFHQDSVCYVPGTNQKQLMLNVTCTNSLYGGSAYPYLADLQDQGRNDTDASQDAFNVYVVDRENKKIKVVRIGNSKKYDMSERLYMEIPYKD